MKKTIAIFFIINFCILFFTACSPDPDALTKQYPIIYNTHKVKDIVNLYTDDAVFEIPGQFTLRGRDQIRDITRYDSVLDIKMSVSNIQVNGDTSRFDLNETNDWLKISGIGDAHYSVYFLFENGLIKHIRAEAKPRTEQAFIDVFTPLIDWAKTERENVLAEMMPEGKFIYNAENAKRTLNLLKDWKNRLK